MGFSFTGESKTAKSGNLCKHLNHCIIIYIYTVYIIGLHQVFLVLLLSLFVSPNSQGPEDAGVSALRVFRSFCCVGLIHWCVPCRLVYITLYPMYPIYFVYLCFIPRLRQFHGGCQLGASGFCWAPHTMLIQHFQDLLCSSQASQAVSRGSGELLPL